MDVAGDPRALGQGGGARLIVLGLEHPGVQVLQGEDLLVKIVPDRVQAPAHALLLDGAQGEADGEDRDDG